MNVRILFLFIGCSSAAVAPGASSTAGCGPECLGTCFAGNCLFTDSQVDDEDLFRSTQSRLAMARLPQAAPGMAAYTAAWEGRAAQPALPPASASLANLDFQSIEPPQPLQQTGSVNAPAAANLNLQRIEPPLPVQQMSVQSVEPPQPLLSMNAPLGATAMAGLGYHSMGVMESKAQELSFELQRSEAHQALLRAQNEQLRHQLEQWKATGTNIAEREAKVVALLNSAPTAAKTPAATAAAPSGTAAAAAGVSPGGSAAEATPSMLQEATRRMWTKAYEQSAYAYLHHGFLFPLLVVAGFLFLVAAGWKLGCFILKVKKGEIGWKEALASKASNQRLQPVLRAMGLAQYKVEVSEIHLGSLFAGSNDVRVNFRMGNGTERRTKVLKNTNGTFLRFDDVLELCVCSSDSACTICVTDRRGDLAHVELPASEVVRLATRPQQEYFRTELTASPGLGDISDRRPYVAMRMRNIIAAPATTPPVVGKAAKTERAYGSFAV